MDKNIQNRKNYNNTIELNEKKYCILYIQLLKRFVVYFNESISVNTLDNIDYILINGFNMLKHVFTQLLLYTKNIDLTYYHSQKAYYYYIEFISQLNENLFLNLNSKDALLFVYRKTIFQINEEYKKTYSLMNEEEDFFNGLFDKLIDITQIIKKMFSIGNNTILFSDDNFDDNFDDILNDNNIDTNRNLNETIIKIDSIINIFENIEYENIFQYNDFINVLKLNYNAIKKLLLQGNSINDISDYLNSINKNGLIHTLKDYKINVKK